MKRRGTISRSWLLIVPMAFCLLAVGSPVQADPPGSEYDGFFAGTIEAADGSTISMGGSVSFHVRGSKNLISGGGGYLIRDPDGIVVVGGDWHAMRLEGFHSEGSCGSSDDCPLPDDWEAGKMTAKIHLDGVGAARLVIWCRLPGLTLPPAMPESFRVDIGSLHFGPAPGAGTLFVRTAD